ncbi:BMP family lipoprotein [Paenibacillus tarimensis]|uniref:BMP family lipoprotein n=1 Tax=Paenibacillus tarimensis TaxID=416012 RepID=UPI001F314960|nr:BMP family ABC transporter substrate-binding protein [Paenibacillus tarimensis]MCF2944284.1 BMP family ABC transporter substrate-binding protein [Paenibacillus tarimensis]
MKNMKKSSFVVSALLAVILVLSACGGGSTGGNGGNAGTNNGAGNAQGGTKAGENFRIGMVTDRGGVNDKSFNQTAWEALKQLEGDTGAKVKYLESKTDADLIPNMNQFIKDGYDLTWGIGFLFEDAAKTVAEQNPDAKIAVIDTVVDLPNVESVTFAEHEGSFLVGVVAGLTTETNKVGFVGGMEMPVIKKFEAGFRAGVAAANPDAKVLVNYVGDFNKPDQAKVAASTFYNDGADIIFHAAGGSGNGVFSEAKDRAKSGKKVWVIGVDKDQALEHGDDVTLTSMIKKVDQAVLRVSNDLIAGEFKGGEVTVLGLKEDGVGLPETNKNLTDEVLQQVEEFKQKIINGEITVPTK